MKKLKVIILTIFLLLPIKVLADTVDYDIKNYYIDANILDNGDLEVTELIVLKGSFNGYIRDITYKNNNIVDNGYEENEIYNASNIEVIDVSAKYVDKVDFNIINETDYTKLKNNTPSNLGVVSSKLSNGISLKMYYKSTNKKVAFKIKYLIKDALVLHKDVAELYWNFIGDNYEDNIHDLQIKVNLPDKDTSDNFRIWAHGDMAGYINTYDNKYLLATLNTLEKYNPVDIRVTFDKTLVKETLITKKTNETALDKIIEVEQKRADIQNQKRRKTKILFFSFLIISSLMTAIIIIIWIYVYFKYDKEYKSEFKHKYNREFIDTYNVEVIDYLVNKNITPNAMSASIMNLIYKKVIKLEEIPSSKNKKDYKFILVDREKDTNETEKYLLDFLFTKVGKENVFTTIDLKNYAKGTKYCEDFSKNYTTWKKKVKKDGEKEEFFEKKGKEIGISVILLGLSFMINFVATISLVILPLTHINLYLSIAFLIYTITFFKRTKKGNEDYAKWMAFKRFLADFGTFELKELPEIVLWERYLVYATVFGLAKKVSKNMNVRIEELQANNMYIANSFPSFTDFYVFNSINDAIISSYQSNVSAVNAQRASSSYSSGGGHGGGFSSGGGHGGGGGGGHGF